MNTSQAAILRSRRTLKRPGAKDSLIIFRNNNEKEFEYSMKKCVSILDQTMKEDSLQQVG